MSFEKGQTVYVIYDEHGSNVSCPKLEQTTIVQVRKDGYAKLRHRLGGFHHKAIVKLDSLRASPEMAWLRYKNQATAGREAAAAMISLCDTAIVKATEALDALKAAAPQ